MTTALGTLERCQSCGWFLVDLKTLAGYSEDKDQFNGLMAEARQFLLPTGRDCPRGAHKLQDGRVRSRGVILTLCPRCNALWSNLDILGQLNEALERSLRAQLETTFVPQESGSAIDWRPGSDAIAPVEDKGFAGFLRGTAHFFNELANRFGKPKPLTIPRAQPAPKPVLPLPVSEPKVRTQAAAPLTPSSEPPAPSREELVIPEPELDAEPLPTPIAEEATKPAPNPEPEPERIPEPTPEPRPGLEQAPEPKPELKLEPLPQSEPEPIPVSELKPKVEPLPEEPLVLSEDKEEARRLILNNLGMVEQPEPAPKTPAVPKNWVDLPQPESPKKGFLSRMKDSLKPKAKPPKAPSKPVAPVPEKKAEAAAPIPAMPAPEKTQLEVPVPKSKPPKKPGFFDLFKPLPKVPRPSAPVIKKTPVPSIPAAKVEEPAKLAAVKTPDKVETPKTKASEKKSAAAPKGKGTIAQFFALFKPLPKPPKAVPPPVKTASEAPVPLPTPVQATPFEPEKPPMPDLKPKPEAKPEPVAPPLAPALTVKKAEKPRGSAISQFFALFKPLPKKEKPKEQPATKAAETQPEPAPPFSVPETNAVLKTPSLSMGEGGDGGVPPNLPTSILPHKGGGSSWKGRLVVWFPRLAPVVLILIVGLAGDDEWGTACVVGVASWAVIRLIYLALMYPFKGFVPATAADLVSDVRPRLKGKPVQLKGRLEIRAGGVVSFVDGTGDIPLDRFAFWEFAARLLAVANLGQYAKEDEVTIQGWYRSSASPFVEVNDIRTPKAARKSMVRWMRWGMALLTLIVFCLILFGMD